jgi:hypothetical protein
MGENASALRVMRQSIENGFFPYPYFATVPLLNKLRGESEFAQLLKAANERHERFKKRFFWVQDRFPRNHSPFCHPEAEGSAPVCLTVGCPMAPNFLLRPTASTKLHAPFLKERRTRGLVQCSLQEIRGVCTGGAGALHGLNKMGRSPLRCFLSRAAKSKNEKDLSPPIRTMRRRPVPACREGEA